MAENVPGGEVYDLRNANHMLKKQTNEQEQAIKRLTVQLRIREQALARTAAKAGKSGNAAADGELLHEAVLNKSALAEQEEEMEALRRRNRQLAERLRGVEIQVVAKAQAQGRTVPYGDRPTRRVPYAVGIHTTAEIAAGRGGPPARRGSGGGGGSRASSTERQQRQRELEASGTPRSTTARSAGPASAAPPPVPSSAGLVSGTGPSADARLLAEQRDAARAEAESLRRQLATSLSVGGGAGLGALALVPGSGSGSSSSTVSVPRGDLLEMERSLKDRTSQVLLLKSRYEHLESRASAERELYDRAVGALEEQNAQIRDARAALQAAEADVSLLRSRLRQQEDGDGELRAARDEIRRLERQLTELCESPFIAEGRDRLGRAEKLESLQQESAALREQVAHLQHSVRSQHLELQALRSDKRETSEVNDVLKEQCSTLRQQAEAAQRANGTLRERLALYSGMVGGMDGTASAGTAVEGGSSSAPAGVAAPGSNSVPPEELERALAIVRRRMDHPARLQSSEGGAAGEAVGAEDAASGGDALTPLLRRKVQQLQLALLSTQRELERSEAMLRAQSAIGGDLSAEVAELNERLAAETGSVRRRLVDTEALAEKRLQRAAMLEAQVKQLLQKLRDVAAAHAGDRTALADAIAAAKEAREQRAVDDAARPAAAAGAGAATGSVSVSATAMMRRRSPAARGALSPRDADDVDDDDDASTVISDLSGEEDRGRGRAAASSSSAATAAAAAAASAAIADSEADADGEASLGDLLDFGPGEDALEIYVVDAMIDPAALGRHDTTFALLDFFDFASQTSPLSDGPAPTYNFSAAYRVETSHAFLHAAATQGATIDINQAKGADFELLARAVVPLHDLLLPPAALQQAGAGSAAVASAKPPTRLRFAALPLVSKGGRIVGSLRCEVRVAVPLVELWAQFQRDRPAEGASLSQLIRDKQRSAREGGAPAPSSGGTGAGSAASVGSDTPGGGPRPNELVVTVVGASDLRPRARAGAEGSSSSQSASAPVSSYVQYGLAGMPQAVTPVVSASADPVFADQRAFPLVPTARLLHALGASPLIFSVVDDAAAAAASAVGASAAAAEAGAALIGTASVSLAAVAEGGSVDAAFDVVDARGQASGRLHVRIGWARPLAAVDGAPPGTLSRAQLHALAAAFDRDGAGVKHELLARAAIMSEDDARALAVVRDAVAAHERALAARPAAAGAAPTAAASPPVSTRWSIALTTAAEAAGRPGLTLSPREAFEALTLPSVRCAVDFDSVEGALLGLLPPRRDDDRGGSGGSQLAAADLVDAFTPLSARAAEALSKLRRCVAALPRGKGLPRLDYALEDAADAAARALFAVEHPTRAQAARLARSGLVAALRSIGMMVVEDAALDRRSSSTAGAGGVSSCGVSGAEAAALDSAVAAAIAPAAPGAGGVSGVTVRVAGAEEELRPSIVSAAFAAAADAAATDRAAAAAASAASVLATPAAATVTGAAAAAADPARRSSSVKALVFDVAAPAPAAAAPSAAAAGEAAVAEPVVEPVPVPPSAPAPTPSSAHTPAPAPAAASATEALSSIERADGTTEGPLFTLSLLSLERLSSALVARAAGVPLFVSFTLPSSSALAAAAGVAPALVVVSGALAADSSSVLLSAHASSTTAWALGPSSTLTRALSRAVVPGSAPELADVVFRVSALSPSVPLAEAEALASGTFSLLDLLPEGSAAEVDVPCEAGLALSGAATGAGAGAVVADLRVAFGGAAALRALVAAPSKA